MLGNQTTSSMKMGNKNTAWSCGTGMERVSGGMTLPAPSKPFSCVKSDKNTRLNFVKVQTKVPYYKNTQDVTK